VLLIGYPKAGVGIFFAFSFSAWPICTGAKLDAMFCTGESGPLSLLGFILERTSFGASFCKGVELFIETSEASLTSGEIPLNGRSSKGLSFLNSLNEEVEGLS